LEYAIKVVQTYFRDQIQDGRVADWEGWKWRARRFLFQKRMAELIQEQGITLKKKQVLNKLTFEAVKKGIEQNDFEVEIPDNVREIFEWACDQNSYTLVQYTEKHSRQFKPPTDYPDIYMHPVNVGGSGHDLGYYCTRYKGTSTFIDTYNIGLMGDRYINLKKKKCAAEEKKEERCYGKMLKGTLGKLPGFMPG